jgi:hypothetical protein
MDAGVHNAVLPNITVVAPDKFVPVSVTVVPPAVVPPAGLIEVIVGAGTTYVYADGRVAVPPGVVTATATAGPAAPAGVTQVTDVALTTVTDVAAMPPNVTADVPIKFVPATVTVVPPAVVPLVGLIDVIDAVSSSVMVAVWTVVAPSVAFVGVPIVRMTVSSVSSTVSAVIIMVAVPVVAPAAIVIELAVIA